MTEVEQIVERCGSDISIFLGAGASMAIDLPDMVTFWKKAYGDDFVSSLDQKCNYKLVSEKSLNQVDAENNNSNILRRLIQTACLEEKTVSPDLEVIYDYIHNTLMLFSDRGDIEYTKKLFHFYNTSLEQFKISHFNPIFTEYCKQYAVFHSTYEQWIGIVQECIGELRTKVDETYLIKRGAEAVTKAEDVYAFLPRLFDKDPPAIFTTNYDTVFEALDESGKLKAIGYSLLSGSKIDTSGWHRYFSVSNYLTKIVSPLFLFHLHGSVAWEQQPEGNIEDHYPKLHESRSAIIEPVISKKIPEKPPFKEMYTIFEKTLQRNKVLLVIGFSFRDKEIKSLVENRLKSSEEFHVVCVAPENKNDPDLNIHLEALEKKYESKFIWLKEYFRPENLDDPEDTTRKILATIDRLLSR